MVKRPFKRSEKAIQLQILKYLRAIGAYAGKTKTMGTQRYGRFRYDPYTFRGFPDLVAFFKNNLYFIECKSETGRVSEDQEKFRLACIQANIPYILARSVEDVQNIIH